MVIIPPRIAAKLRGIKNFPIDEFKFLTIPCIIGIKIITIGVLLMKALKIRTKNKVKKIIIFVFLGK
jgi:hypothetical protein